MRGLVWVAVLLLAASAGASTAELESRLATVREARDAVRDLIRHKLAHMAESVSDTAQRETDSESMNFLSSMKDLENSLAATQADLSERKQETAALFAIPQNSDAIPSATPLMRFADSRQVGYADGQDVDPSTIPAAPTPAPATTQNPPTDAPNKKPAALDGHVLTDTEHQKAQAAEGVVTLKAKVLIQGDKESTTLLGKPGTPGLPCPCAGALNCDCGSRIVLLPNLSNTTDREYQPYVDPNAKPIEVVRTDHYAPSKCTTADDKCNRTLDVTNPRPGPNGTVVYLDKKEETLPNNLVRAFIRKARPIGDNPPKLIKPESYVTPLYEAPQAPAPPAPKPTPPPPPPPPKIDPRERLLPPSLRSGAPFPYPQPLSLTNPAPDARILHMLEQITLLREEARKD